MAVHKIKAEHEVDISYLEDLLDKIKSGKIHIVSISLSRDVKEVGVYEGYIQYEASAVGYVKIDLKFSPKFL